MILAARACNSGEIACMGFPCFQTAYLTTNAV
uniref:Uncharacterized protein n=1 Tax=Neisseria meningitidis alpha275 TaxID=295996 RepID=C6SMN3_NEIME|nr:hypothetical protein predicted by Glimmer/Critica [Neisseria meningitidis alpha275]